jgi:hypothetical protein
MVYVTYIMYMYFFILFMGSQKFSLHNVNIAVEDEGSHCYGKISCTFWGCLPSREYYQICKYREKTFLSLFGCFRVAVFYFKIIKSSIFIVRTSHRKFTANEGPVRIHYKCLVPICVFPEMKLRGLVPSKKEL